MGSTGNSYHLDSVYQYICPTALCFDEHVYIGEGGGVSCYDVDKQKFAWRVRVFDGVRVHGIVVAWGNKLLVHGRNLLKLLSVDAVNDSDRLSPRDYTEEIVTESPDKSHRSTHDPVSAPLSESGQDYVTVPDPVPEPHPDSIREPSASLHDYHSLLNNEPRIDSESHESPVPGIPRVCLSNPVRPDSHSSVGPVSGCLSSSVPPDFKSPVAPVSGCLSNPVRPDSHSSMGPVSGCLSSSVPPDSKSPVAPVSGCLSSPVPPDSKSPVAPVSGCLSSPVSPDSHSSVGPVSGCLSSPIPVTPHSPVGPVSGCLSSPVPPDSKSPVGPVSGCLSSPVPLTPHSPVGPVSGCLSSVVAVDGWIVAASPVSDSVCVLDSTGAVYRISQQFSQQTDRDYMENRCTPFSRCPDPCILYSGCIVSGTQWNCTVLIGGTVFSQILVWRINGQLLHRVCGHTGVVFSIIWHQPSSTIITTSDDRSVRTWSVTSSARSCLGRCVCRLWSDSKVRARLTLFGHRARVWRSVALSHPDRHSGVVDQYSESCQVAVDGESCQVARTVEGCVDSECCQVVRTVEGCVDGESCQVTRTVESESVGYDTDVDGVSVVSIGEDSVVCVWSPGGRLLRTWTAHDGASVRAVAYCQQRHLLVTAGGDGGVLLWPLVELTHSQSHRVPVCLAQYSDGDCGVNGDNVSKTGDCRSGNHDHLSENGDGDGGGDFLRSVFALSSTRCLVVSDRGLVKCISLTGQRRSKSVFIGGCTLTSYCVGSVSLSQHLIALANIHGQVVLLKDDGDDVVWLSTQSVVKSKIFYLCWLSDDSLLISHGDGQICLLRPVFNGCSEPHLSVLSTWLLPGRQSPRWLNCAALAQLPLPPPYPNSDRTAVVCGDRHGYLHLFIQSQEKCCSSIRVHGRHGVSGVTALSSRCMPPYAGDIVTCGRDGCLRHVRIEWFPDSATEGAGGRWGFRHVGDNRLPWDWVCQAIELENNSTDRTLLLVTGFHGSEFVVRSMCLSVDLWRVRCGGGHRSWSLLLPPRIHSSGDTAIFYWLASRRLAHASVQLHHVMPRVVRAGSVCGTTLAAVYLPASPTDGTSGTIVLAGEDTSVRVISVSGAYSGALSVQSAELACGQGHMGSVRTLCVLPGGLGIVSAGGRAQLVLWQVQRSSTAALQLTAVYRHRLKRLEDVRYMDSAVCQSGGERGCSLAVAASDGGIRLFRVSSSLIVCHRIIHVIDHPHCLLQLFWLQTSTAKHSKATISEGTGVKGVSTEVTDSDSNVCGGEALPLLAAFSSTGYVHVLKLRACSGSPRLGDSPAGDSGDGELSSGCGEVVHLASGLPLCNGGNKGRQCEGERELVAPLLSLRVHDSAVNACCWLRSDVTDHVITRQLLTGGDDGSICRHTLSVKQSASDVCGREIGVNLEASGEKKVAHASQVTGVCYLGKQCILTVSVDQRVCVWKLSNSVTPLLCRFTHVADVKGALMFPLSNENSCRFLLVFGEGLEIFRLGEGCPSR